MLSPLHAACPVCASIILLSKTNDLANLIKHVSTNHFDEEDLRNNLKSVGKLYFHSSDEVYLNNRADMPSSNYQIPVRLCPPKGIHYLAFWLNIMINQGILEPNHLIYQQLDALMEVVMRYPRPRPHSWRMWPVLCKYVEKMNSMFSRYVQKFYLGTHKIADPSDFTLEGMKRFARIINHPGDNHLSTIMPSCIINQ
jgi:hypothetical protein